MNKYIDVYDDHWRCSGVFIFDFEKVFVHSFYSETNFKEFSGAFFVHMEQIVVFWIFYVVCNIISSNYCNTQILFSNKIYH